MRSLALRVLGEFGVDGIEPAALGSKKARLALELLALAEGRPVPPDVLFDALWGDSPPSRPEDQLAVLMSRLRSVLGRERIEHRDGGYLLHYDWLDTAELAHLTDEVERRRQAGNVIGAAAAARIVLSLVRGAGRPPPAGDWAQLKRAEIDRLTGRARLAAAAALLAAGDWMAACDAATGALERDPYEETALRILLRGYVMGGQTATALAAYATARERLADDLGTDPSPETAALYTAILRGELPTTASGPAADRVPLVGRDGELAYLDATALRAREGRNVELVIIEGEAGIGKTTLLRAFAAGRESAGDIVLFARCGQLDRSMPLDALLTALSGLLRRLGPEATADVIGADAPVLAPLLGFVRDPRPLSVLADSVLGPAVVYTALARVLGRLSARGPLVLLIDDAHLAGRVLPDLLHFIRREELTGTAVAAIRTGEGELLPDGAVIHLGALSRDAAAELVGAARVDTLYARSRGHPLFLTELAQQAAGADLPASLVESLSARCDELGSAGHMLRTAAIIGPELDLDLLAAVLGRPLIELLNDAEQAVSKQFLAEQDGQLRFRHELVREALAASASAGRAALLHRQAGRVLAGRPGADPVIVAQHARLGGDLALAATALRDASARAAERFDHAAAEQLLDDALSLQQDEHSWLARARVRTRRGKYDQALEDVERASASGAAALEVGAWASYFGRRFAQAAQFAADGALAAADAAMRARCLTVGGRTRHAGGDLAHAELLLGEALSLAEGADRVTAAAWLGVLRSHQSRPAEALALMRPAARGQIGAGALPGPVPPARQRRCRPRHPAPAGQSPRAPPAPAALWPARRRPAAGLPPSPAGRPRKQLEPARSGQQRLRGQHPAFPPCEFLVIAAQRLLPAKLNQCAEQAQRQLTLPPERGVDTAFFQCGAVGSDRRLLRLRQAPAVNGQVPGQVTQRRAAAGLFPVQQDRPAGTIGAQVVQLPVAVHERLRRAGQRLQQRSRIPCQRAYHGCRSWRHLCQQRPALCHQLRHQMIRADSRLGLGHPGRELQVPVHRRHELEVTVPEGRVQRRQMLEETQMLAERDRVIGNRHQPLADVVHQHTTAA